MTWLQDSNSGHIGALVGETPGGVVTIETIEPLLIVYNGASAVDALTGQTERHKLSECSDITEKLRCWGAV